MCMRDLHAPAGFSIVEKIAMKLLLWTTYINQCFRCMFLTKWKVAAILSHEMVILLYYPSVTLLLENDIPEDAIS